MSFTLYLFTLPTFPTYCMPSLCFYSPKFLDRHHFRNAFIFTLPFLWLHSVDGLSRACPIKPAPRPFRPAWCQPHARTPYLSFHSPSIERVHALLPVTLSPGLFRGLLNQKACPDIKVELVNSQPFSFFPESKSATTVTAAIPPLHITGVHPNAETGGRETKRKESDRRIKPSCPSNPCW